MSKRSKHRWHLLVTCVNAIERHAPTMTQCFEKYCHIFSFKADKRPCGFIYYIVYLKKKTLVNERAIEWMYHSKSVFKLFDVQMCDWKTQDEFLLCVFCYEISLYAPDITNLSSVNLHARLLKSQKIIISILNVDC